MPVRSCNDSISPNARKPVSAEIAGWVSRASPITTGLNHDSDRISRPCPTIWLLKASTSKGVQLLGQTVSRGDIIGYVAAGGYGPVVEKSIGLAYLPTDFLAPGTELSVELVGKERTATVVEQPLYDPENKKLLS